MAINVAPQSVTFYDIAKDLGFPICVALILLFQVGPKLDTMAAANAQVASQLAVVSAECIPNRASQS